MGGHGILYAVSHILGGVVASCLFRLTRPEDYYRWEKYAPGLPTRLATEFIGTFMLVLTVALCTIGGSTTTDAGAPEASIAAAATLMCMIYAGGDVSGGHFNPAVTLGIMLCRKVDMPLGFGLTYVVCQLAAAALAGILCTGITGGKTLPLQPNSPYSDWAAYVMEGYFTFILVLTVLSTAYSKGVRTQFRQNYFAMAVGAVIFVAGTACTNVSGANLNPAVSFGIALPHQMNSGSLFYCIGYSMAQLIGAGFAVVIFAIVHAEVYAPKGATKQLRQQQPVQAERFADGVHQG